MRLCVLSLLVLLAGCGSVGPMQDIRGPIDTPVFDSIALDIVDEPNGRVLHKEYVAMYRDGTIVQWGTFVLTQKGVFLLKWNINSFNYSKLFALDIAQIATVKLSSIPLNQLEIVTKTGEATSFALQGATSVQSQILKLKR